MREALLIPLAALALTACGSSDNGKEGTSVSINAKSESGKDVVIKADGKTGTVSVNVPGFDANLKLPKLMLDNADFDIDGVELYPGSTVQSVNVVADDSAGEDSANVKVAFKAPADPATVRDWFAKEFSDHSVDVSSAGQGLTGKTKDGDAFTISFAPEGAKATNGTIEIIG